MTSASDCSSTHATSLSKCTRLSTAIVLMSPESDSLLTTWYRRVDWTGPSSSGISIEDKINRIVLPDNNQMISSLTLTKKSICLRR